MRSTHDLLRNIVAATTELRIFAADAVELERTGGIQAPMAATDAGMTCRELVDCLGEYVAGTLDAATRARLDAHLAACATCLAYLRTYGDTIRLAKDAGRDDERTAAEMPAELVDAIVAANKARRR